MFGASLLVKMAPLLRHFGKVGLMSFPLKKVSMNSRFIELMLNDPLIYKSGIKYFTPAINLNHRIGWGLAMVDGMKHIMTNAAKINTPFLLYHGDSDRIVWWICEPI